jgi:hypothetical protein
MPLAQTIVSVVATALAAWFVKGINEVFGVQLDAKHREALQTAATNAVSKALGISAPDEKGSKSGKAVVNEAKSYVKAAVPDALKHFEIKPDEAGDQRLESLLEAKLTQQVMSSRS